MHHDTTLAGHGIRLVPLALDHAPALLNLIDPALWAGMITPVPRTVDQMAGVIGQCLDAPDRLGFTVLGADSGEVRGSSWFYDVHHGQERCEIGNTFYGRQWWGGHTNPACKLLMLTHAFDMWGMHRVALRADTRNTRSIGAITRMGAVPEGVLRGHRVGPDGSRGDTAYFSILAPEWPPVRARLLDRLGADRPADQASDTSIPS